MSNTKTRQIEKIALEKRLNNLNETFKNQNITFLDYLGSGGYGDVYKAEIDGTQIAIKVLRQCANLDDYIKAKQVFMHEASLYNHINGKELFTNRNKKSNMIFGGKVNEYNGNYYMPLELMDMTFRDFLTKYNSDIQSKLRLVRDYAIGIGKNLHEKDICHKDIKPENLFLKETYDASDAAKCIDWSNPSNPKKRYYIAKVGDLGTAVKEGEKLPYLEENVVSGTLKYIAPEILRGEKEDRRSDIYSLGAVLYEIMYKTHPTGTKDPCGKIDAKAIINYISEISKKENEFRIPQSNIEKEIQNVLKKAVAKKKEERFNNMYEFANAIDYILKENTGTAKMQSVYSNEPDLENCMQPQYN